MSAPAVGTPTPRLPNLPFYSIVTVFWAYACFTRTGQWQLLSQALPRWGIPSVEVQLLEFALMYPLLIVFCEIGRRIGYDVRAWRRIVSARLRPSPERFAH